MKSVGKTIRLVDDEQKKYLLEKCDFKPIYEKYKGDLEKRAVAFVCGQAPTALLNPLIDETEVGKEACKKAVIPFADHLAGLPYIEGYLASATQKGEDREALTRTIAELVLQE